jgi:hypothetical protein
MRRQVIHAQRLKTTPHSHHPELPQRTRSPISPLAMRTPLVQPKLTVNPPGDRYEQEADEMADQVMRMPEPKPTAESVADPIQPLSIQRKCTECESQIQRQPETKENEILQTQSLTVAVQRQKDSEEENKDEKFQAKEVGGQAPKVSPALETRLAASRNRGEPLPDKTQAFMESRFGQDFSSVRVHTDADAVQMNRELNAQAFTHGQDVFFGSGKYRPEAGEGKRLLAHELTHVVQQTGDHYDQNANQVSNAIMRIPEVLTKSEQSIEEEPGILSTIGGGLMGEFNEDPTFAMIGVDLGVSLIPIADQASDVRDIAAHLYYMIFQSQYDRFMRWLGLAFTLIGLVPEVGSAIKGASKFIIKGVREVLSHLSDLLRPLQGLLPEIIDFGRLHRYISSNWDRWVAFGINVWNRTLERITRIINAVPAFVSSRLQPISMATTYIRNLAPQKLREGFAWVRTQWDDIAERLGRRESQAAGTTRVTDELDDELDRSFSRTFDQPEPIIPTRQTTPGSPERVAGFTVDQIRRLPTLLSRPLTDGNISILGRLWQQTANAGDVAMLSLSNSRRLFNNHRNRFWRSVATDPEAKALLTSAGLNFDRLGTAPFLTLPSGQRIVITIDHMIERQTAPGRALDPANLQLVFGRENTVVLRLLNQLDPFQ